MFWKLKTKSGGPLEAPKPPLRPPRIKIPGLHRDDPTKVPKPPAPPGFEWVFKGGGSDRKRRGKKRR
jgi:hypothetical protein